MGSIPIISTLRLVLGTMAQGVLHTLYLTGGERK